MKLILALVVRTIIFLRKFFIKGHLIQGDPSRLFTDPTIFSDIDGTLVIWHQEDHLEAIPFNCYGTEYKLVPNKENIKKLKEFHNKGYTVIVWSAAGSGWCQEVVKKLKLKKYVKYCVSKPEYFLDDLKAEKFLPENRRFNHEYIKQEDSKVLKL